MKAEKKIYFLVQLKYYLDFNLGKGSSIKMGASPRLSKSEGKREKERVEKVQSTFAD